MSTVKRRARIVELQAECDDCTWTARNTGSMSDRSTSRAARRHAAEEGHRTRVESEQTVHYTREAAR